MAFEAGPGYETDNTPKGGALESSGAITSKARNEVSVVIQGGIAEFLDLYLRTKGVPNATCKGLENGRSRVTVPTRGRNVRETRRHLIAKLNTFNGVTVVHEAA